MSFNINGILRIATIPHNINPIVCPKAITVKVLFFNFPFKVVAYLDDIPTKIDI